MADMTNPIAPGPAALAEFINVTKTYPDRLLRRRPIQAVQDVSFRVVPGEVLGLLGPNRAGKTTLVKLLLSLCRPTSGQLLRFGKPIDDRKLSGGFTLEQILTRSLEREARGKGP